MIKIHTNLLKKFEHILGNTNDSEIVSITEESYDKIKKEIFSDVEIHMLICKKDSLMGLNNLKSLLVYDEFKPMKIFLHDDGSLTDFDKSLFDEFDNLEIIDRNVADKNILEYIKEYDFCKKYRLVQSHIHLWHKIKLFDYFFFSKTKRILGIDSDLLFIKKPDEILELMLTESAFYFPDNQNAYCFNEPKDEISVLQHVNTGLIYLPSESHYNISSIENALRNLLKNDVNYFPSWIEQSAFAHMFWNDGRYTSLPNSKYRIPYFQSVDVSKVECLHFVSYPATRELYKNYVNYLSLETSTEIYYKEFFIDYKSIKIPLKLWIKKSKDFFICEYYWGLKETNQNFLDHHFNINDGEIDEYFKFHSDEKGFFVFKPKNNVLKIKHTYDWYGEMNWIFLDSVNL